VFRFIPCRADAAVSLSTNPPNRAADTSRRIVACLYRSSACVSSLPAVPGQPHFCLLSIRNTFADYLQAFKRYRRAAVPLGGWWLSPTNMGDHYGVPVF
jgi:hypothetical protein